MALLPASPLVHAHHKKAGFYAQLLQRMVAGKSAGLRTIIKSKINVLLEGIR